MGVKRVKEYIMAGLEVQTERVAQTMFENHTHAEACKPDEIVFTTEGVMKILEVGTREYTNHILDVVYERIKHGDEEHIKWLKDKCEEIKREI